MLKKGKNAAACVHFWFGLLLFFLGSLHGYDKEWSFLEYLLTVAIIMRSLPPNPSPSRLWAARATPTDLGVQHFRWQRMMEHLGSGIIRGRAGNCLRSIWQGK